MLTNVIVGLVSATFGFGARTVWEEHRDFLGALRVVTAELRANARAAEFRHARGGASDHGFDDASYRSVQLVLARRLPWPLYRDLEGVYRELALLARAGPGTTGRPDALSDVEQAMDELADQLERYRLWTRPLVWLRERRTAG